MKRGIYILMLILMSTFSLAYTTLLQGGNISQTTGVDAYDTFSATALRYEPYPLRPGDNFEVWLSVKNLGSSTSKNVEVELIQDGPFKSSYESNIVVSEIPQYQEAVFNFKKIQISSDLMEGTYDLKFRIYHNGYYGEYQTIYVPISIRAVYPIIELKAYSDPEYLEQGSKGKLILELKTTEDLLMKEVSVNLNLPSSFIPIGSTTEKKISTLSPGQTYKLIFEVMPLSDAESKPYSIPFVLNYFDEAGINQNKTDYFGVLVQKPIDYELNLEETDNFVRGKTGKVVLSVSNVGPTEIKYMTMEILPSEDYEVIGNSKTYLGNLEADDFESGQFTINAQESKEIKLRVELRYKDGFNKDYSEIKEIPLRIYSNSELKVYGLSGSNGNPIISFIFIIIVILLVYWTYKAWREFKDIGKAVKIAFRKLLKLILNLISKLRWSYIKRIPRKIKLYIQSQS
ncbi:MAG: hypothetical protein PHE43_01595 [Candidatus Nanoarchaeia archaeon]|nr:hypothetical protein [Candidatus Nanoarchaeia archaeon]